MRVDVIMAAGLGAPLSEDEGGQMQCPRTRMKAADLTPIPHGASARITRFFANHALSFAFISMICGSAPP
jgi:hypothetical protein